MSITDTRHPTDPDKVWLYRRWFSQQEAASYLGVTDRTIRNYIRTGTIRGHRLKGSRLIRIDRQELEQALRPIPAAGGAR
jgi:excisionase family DNA binding protein